MSNAAYLQAAPASDVFVAADVGGTHVRIALMRAGHGMEGGPELIASEKYRCADHPGLCEIFQAFFGKVGGGAVRRGVIASAGYTLEDGSVITANLPWPLVPARIRDRLGMQQLELVNDFEAVAHAAGQMDGHQVLHLAGPRIAGEGPVLVLGPGTGLGAAVFLPAGRHGHVLATEAGHAALAAGSDAELELLRELRRTRRHVAVEHLISGPGLLTLYATLAALRGQVPTLQAPDQITRAAVAGQDVLARDALSMFCGLLGSVVGDMALQYGARSVRLAGGFLPQIADFLAASEFARRMCDKGALRPALEQVTVTVVEHGLLGVIGAAQWLKSRDSGLGTGES